MECDRAVADELARSQRFDRAVSTAMHDVPLPAGLLERLEAKLAEAGESETAESTGDVALPPAPARFSRRWNHGGSVVGRGLALIAVSSMFWPQPGRQVSNAELAELSSAWLNQEFPDAWKLSPLAPTAYAVPRGVLGANAWQPFTTSAGEKGVVYDLRTGLRPPARLFVIATPHTYQVGTLPTMLKSTTGNIAVMAWQCTVGCCLWSSSKKTARRSKTSSGQPNVALVAEVIAAPPT